MTKEKIMKEIKEEEKNYCPLEERMNQQTKIMVDSLKSDKKRDSDSSSNVPHSILSEEIVNLYEKYDNKEITWDELKTKIDEIDKRDFS